MHGVVDFRATHEPTAGGYGGLLALARQLVGERLLFARRGYPDELKLHLGVEVRSEAPKGRTLTRGSYVLGAAASAWMLKSARLGVAIHGGEPDEAFTPLAEDRLARILASVGGPVVTDVEVRSHPLGYGLVLLFNDGSAWAVWPTPPEEGAADVPDWELFTPYGRYLRVGPGPTWAYLPSDQPEKG